MFTLQDGREHLYQWDLDRYIIVEDSTIGEVHFCNRTTDCSLVVEVKDGLAAIPNIILQDARPIRAYAYVDDKYTLVEQQFTVKSRTRPADYIYTETEVKRWEDLAEKAEAAVADAEAAVKEAETAASNANKAIEDFQGQLDGLATEDYVDEAVASAGSAYYFDLSSITDNNMWLRLPDACWATADAFVANGEKDTVVYIKADSSLYSVAPAKYVSNKIFIYADERPKTRADKALDHGYSQFELLKNIYNEWTVKKTAATNILVTADYINNKGYATASEVQTLINNSLGVIENGTY